MFSANQTAEIVACILLLTLMTVDLNRMSFVQSFDV